MGGPGAKGGKGIRGGIPIICAPIPGANGCALAFIARLGTWPGTAWAGGTRPGCGCGAAPRGSGPGRPPLPGRAGRGCGAEAGEAAPPGADGCTASTMGPARAAWGCPSTEPRAEASP